MTHQKTEAPCSIVILASLFTALQDFLAFPGQADTRRTVYAGRLCRRAYCSHVGREKPAKKSLRIVDADGWCPEEGERQQCG